MRQQCEISGAEFEITDGDRVALDKLSPVLNGMAFRLPNPKLCPDERKRRRLAYRNERNLYRRNCDLTGASIVSAFSPDKPYKVFSKEAWWSDRWEPLEYGREFDFSRPFFEQFAELKRAVPQIALMTSPDADEHNSLYVNFAGFNRNCYMTFDSDFNEDSYQSNVLKHSKHCLDCSYVQSSELCYECIDCTNCYSVRYSQDCSGCSSSYFLRSCIGCADCFMCVNLNQKQYYFRNQPCSRDEYFAKLEALGLHHWSAVEKLKTEFDEFHLRYPKKYCRILRGENCLGDYIANSRNCFQCYNIADGWDLRYCDALYDAKDCMDVSSFGEKIECVYNSGTIGVNCFNILMSYVIVQNCSDLMYCDNCRQSQNCFGCCSLKRHEYCILNKQYSKEAYFSLLPRVLEHLVSTGEWGEYFPLANSPFGYNETMANEYFPMGKAEAKKFGAKWSDYKAPAPEVETVEASDLPDSIADVREDILNRAIVCEQTGRPFRLTKAEFLFHSKNGIPLPHYHPDVRYSARITSRNPQHLWQRICAKTGKPIFTSYSSARPEIVFSEEAFLEALI